MSQNADLSTDIFWFLVRVCVGLIFAYAGFMKLIEPRANFEAALSIYPLIPFSWLPLISVVIPWCEWIFGSFLILGFLPRFSASVICVLLAGFLILIATGPLLGGKASEACGCFGKSGFKISVKTEFVIDMVSLILAAAMVGKRRFPWSLDRWLRR